MRHPDRLHERGEPAVGSWRRAGARNVRAHGTRCGAAQAPAPTPDRERAAGRMRRWSWPAPVDHCLARSSGLGSDRHAAASGRGATERARPRFHARALSRDRPDVRRLAGALGVTNRSRAIPSASLSPRHHASASAVVAASCIVVDTALVLVLLIGAGLLLKSFWSLRRVDPGVPPRGVADNDRLVARTRLSDHRSETGVLCNASRTPPGAAGRRRSGGGQSPPVRAHELGR